MTKSISIFGATGSIGDSAADVILSASDMFNVNGVTAHSNVEKLAQRARNLNAQKAVIADEALFQDLKNALSGTDIAVAAGTDALEELAAEKTDVSLMAIMGFAGLRPLIKAIEQGGAVAIANKEPLVAAGPFVMQAAQKSGATLLPIDSEHNAIFQVFENDNRKAIERIILTGSGGPFRGFTKGQLAAVTREQALKHPNWDMGAKITIDSATLTNKALEVIEAHYLFDMPADQIDVIIHPQSTIHSMVEYCDGSVLAQMGASDMRTPLANVMNWPQRLKTPGARLDLTAMARLDFEASDADAFPSLAMGYQALKEGLHAQIAFNAANEIAVQRFLTNKAGFLDIMICQDHILGGIDNEALGSIDDVEAFDAKIRALSADFLKQRAA